MNSINFLVVDLKLHDEAATNGAPAAGTAPTDSQASPADGQQGTSGENTAPAAGEKEANKQQDTSKNRHSAFRELINGEYKDLYDKNVQEIINRRFKETKNLRERNGSLENLAVLLSDRYGIEDPEQLAEAIKRDNKFIEEQAEEAGMLPEQYREFKRLERENNAFRRWQQDQEGRRQSEHIYNGWVQESEGMKADFPEFELRRELDNAQFRGMLTSGVSVRTAYEVAHLDDIKSQAATAAGKKAEKNLADNIKAKGQRPAEAGAASAAGVIVKSDVSQLTPEMRRELADRARRGEIITFN